MQGHTASATYRVQRSYGCRWDIQPDQLDVPTQCYVTSCIIFAVYCRNNRCCPLASSSTSISVCNLCTLAFKMKAAISHRTAKEHASVCVCV